MSRFRIYADGVDPSAYEETIITNDNTEPNVSVDDTARKPSKYAIFNTPVKAQESSDSEIEDFEVSTSNEGPVDDEIDFYEETPSDKAKARLEKMSLRTPDVPPGGLKDTVSGFLRGQLKAVALTIPAVIDLADMAMDVAPMTKEMEAMNPTASGLKKTFSYLSDKVGEKNAKKMVEHVTGVNFTDTPNENFGELVGIPGFGIALVRLGKGMRAADDDVTRRLNAGRMKKNTKATVDAKKKAAKIGASENKVISSNYIKQFEQKIGARSFKDIDEIVDESKIISTLDKNGFLVIDPTKARNVGKRRLASEETSGLELDPKTSKENLNEDIPEFMGQDIEGLTLRILQPDKLEAFTAAAADIIKMDPDVYDNGLRLVDNLFQMSVNKDIIPPEKLVEILNKYDLSFEDYATMVLGSASDAGTVLGKFGQMTKRIKPKSVKVDAREKELLENQKVMMNTWRRVNDIRRGLLVSQLATAMRNLSSAGIRAPLEGLGNVMDTALYNVGKAEGFVDTSKAAGRELVTLVNPFSRENRRNWRGSFRHLEYILDPVNATRTKPVVDFILDRPELTKEFDRMFNQLNEVSRGLDKSTGTGTVRDKVLSGLEKGVDVLNGPNRFQEFLIRRGTMLAELERLANREYGLGKDGSLDFMQLLNDGKLNDFLNDAPDLVPKGAKSFKTLVNDATERALDITYAKQPNSDFGREITSFITRNGLTAIMPFPRFMFNSFELAGDYTIGSLQPLRRKALETITNKKGTAPLTAKERQQVTRNIVGVLGLLPAAYMYRMQDDAPTDYKMMKTDDGNVIDTTPQSPLLRQTLWVAEFIKRQAEGTLSDYLDWRDIKETWLGVNLRSGVGNVLTEDISKLISAADASSGQKAAKLVGKSVGTYLASFGTPLNQFVELQRTLPEDTSNFPGRNIPVLGDALVQRTSVKKEFEPEPIMLDRETEGTFGNVIDFFKMARPYAIQPFATRGYLDFFDPGAESSRPNKQTLFQPENVGKRVEPLLKVFTGLGKTQESSKTGKELEKLGFKGWKLRTKSISPGFKNFDAKFLRAYLPTILEQANNPRVIGMVRDRARMRPNDERQRVSDKNFVRAYKQKVILDSLKDYRSSIDSFIAAEGGGDVVFEVDGTPVDLRLTQYLVDQQAYRKLSAVDRKNARLNLPLSLQTLNRGDEKPDFGIGSDHIRIMIESVK